MPTYLTPGVYVEEVPSANKPIEGVSTSVAAFIGLTPGGPVNTPMRISNWTQFAKIFGDPSNPDNGPFMDGTYMAHSVYGFFQNGGTNCWIVRVGEENGAGARPQAALPAATDKSVEAFRAQALPKVDGTVDVELTEEPKAGDGDPSYRLVVTSGSEKEEYDGLTLKKGRNNLATKVNAGSKLIKIEETGASLPDAQRVPATGKYTLSAPAQEPSEVKPTHFSGDEARRKGMGAVAAIDEVTMVLMPDLWTHRQRHPGARPAGQDDRPLREHGRPDGDPRLAARPAAAGDPRVADEHRRLRLEDVRALLPVDRGRWTR